MSDEDRDSDLLEGWEREAKEILGPIRSAVGWPENPSDPDEWPSGRNEFELTHEYIAALESTLVAERRVRRMMRNG